MSVCLHNSISLTLDTSKILIHLVGTKYSIQINASVLFWHGCIMSYWLLIPYNVAEI